eukprot:MONOS_5052.1-p1 / transcript=MONOS_5052.1 / gene=MONOS_5052 / organism=Monocercomonoides_exilis_PA203 / gene_product=unspecified product / transcript_product=unspecified product / location=Mono_scaffold00143:21512-22921(-) / protein_length=378 / sequence_SO=supercontig / SO=protein_coding / is_pseudo=false
MFRIEEKGEMDASCAQYYYNYGDSLLRLMETEEILESDPNNNEVEKGEEGNVPKSTLTYKDQSKSPQKGPVIDLDEDLVGGIEEKQIDDSDSQELTISKEKRQLASEEKSAEEKILDGTLRIKGDESVKEEKENEKQVENKDKEDENVDTLQIAWESLELARVLFNKVELSGSNPDAYLDQIKTYLRLGDAGLEAGRNDDAAEDYKRALALMQAHFLPNDKRIANCHISIAISQPDDVSCQQQHFGSALRILRECLQKLNDQEKENKTETASNEDSSSSSSISSSSNLKGKKPEKVKLEEMIEDLQLRLAELKHHEMIAEELKRTLQRKGFDTTSGTISLDMGKILEAGQTQASQPNQQQEVMVLQPRKKPTRVIGAE